MSVQPKKIQKATCGMIYRESSHFEMQEHSYGGTMFHRKVMNVLYSRSAFSILKSLMTWPRCDSHSPLCAKALICVWSFDPE